MKTTVWRFGLLSGVAAIVMMAITLPLLRAHRMELADTLGYSSMLLAAILVFFGIRSYRERVGQGRLSFRKGLAVGALISLISGTTYALAFAILYFQVAPDFGELFATCMVQRVEESGGSLEEIAKTQEQAAFLKNLYDQPLTNAALSFATTLPLGLVSAALAALILRRR